jgi:hypothetical protein
VKKQVQQTREQPLLALLFAEPVSSTLKMEAISSSETSVEPQRTTRRHIPEDDTLQNHRCENLKFYMIREVIKWNLCVFLGNTTLF